MNVIELALTANHKFTFDPIVESKEHNIKGVITEDFQEYRLAQQPYKSLAICEEVIVCLIESDQAEINVGIGISRIPGVGAAEEGGHHTLICLASNHKAVNSGLTILLYFLHLVVSFCEGVLVATGQKQGQHVQFCFLYAKAANCFPSSRRDNSARPSEGYEKPATRERSKSGFHVYFILYFSPIHAFLRAICNGLRRSFSVLLHFMQGDSSMIPLVGKDTYKPNIINPIEPSFFLE